MQHSVVAGPLLPGMPVTDLNGQFLGRFVINLTDNSGLTPLDLAQIDRAGPSWFYLSGRADSLPIKTLVYGSRAVYSAAFGSVEQLLIKSFGELVWVNAPRSVTLFDL